MNLEVNIESLRKTKNYEEVAEIAEKLMDDVERFQGQTKAELIRLMAEKLEEAGYPILEIREKILERLGVRVTRVYISRCLDDRFKNPKRVAAGQAIRAAENQTNTGASGSTAVAATVMQEPEFNDTEADINDNKYLARKNWETPDIVDPETEEEQLTTTTIRILKLNTVTVNRLINASTACKKEVYLTVDTRTNQVREIQSDVEWGKQNKRD